MKPKLEIKMSCSGLREIPSSIIEQRTCRLIYRAKDEFYAKPCFSSKQHFLPEELGDLEKLEKVDANFTLISQPPSSIVRLNKLKLLTFAKQKSEARVYFVFPRVNEGLFSLKHLDLSDCNLIDGGLPEDVGSLSSLEMLNLSAQLGALQYLDLSYCKRLKELPGFMGMQNLETLDLSHCNLIDGGLVEDIGCLSSLKVLDLSGNNFEHLPQRIAQRLIRLQEAYTASRISTNDISDSQSLSLRVFTSCTNNIPSLFHHQGMDTRVSVNLPENWYVSDNFLGFVVCYSGKLIDIRAQLIPLCVDGKLLMPQKLALSNHLECLQESKIHFFLVPIACLWDASNANGAHQCVLYISTVSLILPPPCVEPSLIRHVSKLLCLCCVDSD
ncbi:hypothetical protein KY284_003950 [Solanum tuberosum]|nr:hypothetical protein KY284_003950 [Solanum tuberosum]